MSKRNIGQKILDGLKEIKQWLLGEKDLITTKSEMKKPKGNLYRMDDGRRVAFSLPGNFYFKSTQEQIEKELGEGYVIETVTNDGHIDSAAKFDEYYKWRGINAC